MRLSQADLASYLDVSRAALSQATSRGHKCGGYPVGAWAVYDGAGRVTGYDVPDRVMHQHMPDEPSVPAAPASNADDMADAASGIITKEDVREILRTELRENPAPKTQEDYLRPTAAGGLSYVMGKAVDGDSGTARAAVISAATLFGALVGHEVSDRSPVGALLGALLVGGLGWSAMQGTREAPSAQQAQPDADTGTSDSDDGTTRRPIRAVGT